MSTLDYTDIRAGVYFKMDGAIYEAVDSVYSKKSRQKGSNQVRMKNLSTGAVVTKTLHASDRLEDVDIVKENYIFVYARGNDIVVHPEGNESQRTTLSGVAIENINLIPAGTRVVAMLSDEEVIAVRPPIKVDVVVKEAPPAVRGNTAQGGSKRVVIETGATVNAPLFIADGDVIRVNTETREYVERVSKK